MDKSSLLGNLTKFSDCVLLDDVERSHHGVWYMTNNSAWKDERICVVDVSIHEAFEEFLVCLDAFMIAKFEAFI